MVLQSEVPTVAELPASLVRVDRYITHWMAKHGVDIVRVALGVIFLWFGFLKYFPGVSSEEVIATRTMGVLSFGFLSPEVSRVLLATWECAIGLGLITHKALRVTLLLLFTQMLGTLMPLVIFPGETFAQIPLVPTLQGQFIIKNFVMISAAIIVGASVRGGRMVANPSAARAGEEHEEQALS